MSQRMNRSHYKDESVNFQYTNQEMHLIKYNII